MAFLKALMKGEFYEDDACDIGTFNVCSNGSSVKRGSLAGRPTQWGDGASSLPGKAAADDTLRCSPVGRRCRGSRDMTPLDHHID